MRGQTETVTLAQNEIRETRKPMSRIGIRIGPKTRDIALVDNRIEGYAVDVSDLRRPPPVAIEKAEPNVPPPPAQ